MTVLCSYGDGRPAMCDGSRGGTPLCHACEEHLRRNGTLKRRSRKGERRAKVPTYRTVHSRLDATRGKASEYECVECGKPAAQWAFDKPRGFSTNLNRYQPMCTSCHIKKDRRER